MPASHHSLSLTPLRVLACLALLSVVAAGIAITVILSQSTNPMFSIRREVIVPDLSGMDWQQAQVEQSAAQLSIVWDTRYSAQAKGIVIAQKTTAGSTVKQGQKLILSVSKGPNTITVPDLKSQNRSDAIQTLRDAGFTVSVDYIRNDPTLQADTVILQSPAAGTALEAGDCITLTVARAVPDPFRQVPSLLGMSVAEARRRHERYDLIFVDPPTFSNSKAMGRRTWDVQRDHVELLVGVSRLLADGGVAVFSCNLRTFKPDLEELARCGVELEDITAQTIPHDFERNAKIHCCYLVRKA